MQTSSIAAALISASLPLAALAQPSEGLAAYFGFGDARIIVVDEDCGPAVAADFNADGRPDIAVANNRKSRVEIHYLRDTARTPEEAQRALRANELPPNPWYDIVKVSVGHRVGALAAIDADGDRKTDLIYAGADPSEIVVLRQVEAARFEVLGKQRVRELSVADHALAVADVQGDAASEVVAIAGGKVNVFPLARSGRLGEPVVLGGGAGGEIRSIRVADFSGDGRADVLATVPEDSAPLRLWVQSEDARLPGRPGFLSAELRFEMPALMDAAPLRFPSAAGASVGVIERATRRLVFYDLTTRPVAEPTGPAAEREVRAAVTSFPDAGGGTKGRSVALADVDADGMTDLITTDQKTNALILYRQQKGQGLSRAEPFSAFKAPRMIDAGRWTDSKDPKVFVLSEQEKAVGLSGVDPKSGRIDFPKPLALVTGGATPVAMAWFESGSGPVLAVLAKAQRDYTLELHQDPDGDGLAADEVHEAATIAVKDLKRDPSAILPFDADRDGVLDILLLTPGEAMTLVSCEAKAAKSGAAQIAPNRVLTKDQMLQFGLVQAAGPDNTARLDMDGDGRDELLIADANYVRACAYDVKSGWRVVSQVNVPDSTTQFVGLTLLRSGNTDPRIVAADKGGGRLVTFAREPAAGGGGSWTIADRIRLMGFAVGPIRAGSFGGDGEPSVLCISDDAFALVRLAGRRPALEEFAAFRSESEDRQDHHLVGGDLNSDGFLDVVSLDAREQMCQILTFSATRKAYLATEFEVFQSRLFRGGDSREFEPRDALIAELTGDERQDLLLTVHDRLIVYPQAAPR